MRPLLKAYVDETGDRGASGKSSPLFAFAAVIVPEADEVQLRLAVTELRSRFKVPVGKALHWKEHTKAYSRRQFAAKTLSRVPSIMVVYVVVEKAAIPGGSGMLTDHVTFYNYAAGILMERILLASRDWPTGPRDVKVRFGHVRGFDHRTTRDYFATKRAESTLVPWDLLRGDVEFDGMAKWDGLQAADQFAGMLNSAIRQDPFGGYEEAHLLAVRRCIRRSEAGVSWGFGFNWLGNEQSVKGLPWWPKEGI